MALKLHTAYEMAEGVLGCLCAALDEARVLDPTLAGCPCRSYVAPGSEVAWDGCGTACGDGCAGQLTVHLAGLTTSDVFPPGASRVVTGHTAGCAPPAFVLAELVVTLLRCVPVPDDLGTPPSAADLALAARQQLADSAAVYDALQCCVSALAPPGRVLKYILGRQRTLGPSGGCAGVEHPLTVALRTCPCPDEGTVPA